MTFHHSGRQYHSQSRKGFALFYCVLVIALVSVVVLGVLETEATQVREVSNRIEQERAILLADAGLADALSRLEVLPTLTGVIGKTELPQRSGRYYTVRIRLGTGGVVIEATGVSRKATYTKSVTVSLSS